MNKTILIVDDEKNIRSTLVRALEKDDVEILTAINGEEAVQVLEKRKDIDVMLLDMKLPGMDGLEVLRRIQKLPERPVVVMMTAYGTINSAVEAMKLGAVDYISKPFSPIQMRELLGNIEDRKAWHLDDAVDFEKSIEIAKENIRNRQYKAAEDMIKKAISYNPQVPAAFNLLGVLLELTGKVSEAQKNYRAALALDPTYQPAEENLHRTAQFKYTQQGINLGDVEDKEEKDKGGK